MRTWIMIILGCVGCAGAKGAAVPTREDRAVAVADECTKGSWFPGATDPAAPRLTVHLVNGLPAGVVAAKDEGQPGVCLVLDGHVLLSAKDQALIESRAKQKETITWSAKVAPGDHVLGVFLALHQGDTTSRTADGRLIHVTNSGTVTIGVAGEQGVFAWGGDEDVTVTRMPVSK